MTPGRFGRGRVAARLVPKPDVCLAAVVAVFVAYGLTLPGPRAGASREETPMHAGRVEGVAVSPDGRVAASAGRDGTLKVWDIAALRQVGAAVEVGGGFACVAYATEGDTFVAGGLGGELLVVESGATRTLRGPSASAVAVRAVAFAPCGDAVAAGLDDGTVTVWDVASGRLRCELHGHVHAEPGPDFAQGAEPPASIQGLAYSPDGRTLASAGVDGKVMLWDPSSGRLKARIPGGRGPLWSVAFSPGGREVAAGGSLGGILIDVGGGPSRPRLFATGRVTSVAYVPGRARLASAGPEGVDLWDVSGDPARLYRLHGGGNRVKALAVAPDGTRIVAGTAYGGVLSWDLTE